MLKIFKNFDDRPVAEGEIRFHLVGHECDDPEKYPTSANMKGYIKEKGYVCCSMLEFIWFCINKIPDIDRPYRSFEVVTLGVEIDLRGKIVHPMLMQSTCVSNFMGGSGIFSSIHAFPRKTFALAIEKLD